MSNSLEQTAIGHGNALQQARNYVMQSEIYSGQSAQTLDNLIEQGLLVSRTVTQIANMTVRIDTLIQQYNALQTQIANLQASLSSLESTDYDEEREKVRKAIEEAQKKALTISQSIKLLISEATEISTECTTSLNELSSRVFGPNDSFVLDMKVIEENLAIIQSRVKTIGDMQIKLGTNENFDVSALQSNLNSHAVALNGIVNNINTSYKGVISTYMLVESENEDTYVVKSGDSLSAIASKYGTTHQELAKYNNISNANVIHVNQEIKIPPTSLPGATNVSIGQSHKDSTITGSDALKGVFLNTSTAEKMSSTVDRSQTTSGSNSSLSYGSSVVEEATEHLGKPYVWGTRGPDNFDCSGYVKYVFEETGVASLSHQTVAMYNQVTHISAAEAQPGDLVFFSNDYSRKNIEHVGIYLGNNEFIHASSAGGEVKITSTEDLYRVQNLVGYGRV